MSFVDVLPESTCWEILSLWCEVEDLAKLDSAFCNSSARNAFVRLTQWELFFLSPTKSLSQDIISWFQLKRVKLSRFKVHGKSSDVNNIDYAGFINSCCNNLNSLEIVKVAAINDKVILNLKPEILGRITTLQIHLKTGISSEGVLFMANHCHKLRHLSLDIDLARCGISEEDVTLLIRANPQLISINISSFNSITNHLFNIIAESCPLLTKLTVDNARSATITSFTNVLNRCKKVENMSITLEEFQFFTYTAPGGANSLKKRLYCHCVSIREADIPISDWFINKVVGFQAVSFIYPVGVDPLNDAAMEIIATNNPGLQEFRAGDCETFTMTGVRQLLRRCVMLTTLEFRDCDGFLTFEAIKEAFSTPNVLTTLIFDHVPIWTEAVIEIVRHCSSLKNLVLCDCHNVDSDIVRITVLEGLERDDINISLDYSPELLLQ